MLYRFRAVPDDADNSIRDIAIRVGGTLEDVHNAIANVGPDAMKVAGTQETNAEKGF